MIQSKFFIGVVEDIKDPSERGRARVRIFGKHSDVREEVPTSSLPWSSVMMPCTEASVSGIGASHGLLPGSWVMGTYIDGDSENEAIILGSIPGESTKADPSKGFSDPNGVYPRKTGVDLPSAASSSSYSSSKAYIQQKNTSITDIPTASPSKASTLDKDPSHDDSYFEPKTWSLPKIEENVKPSYPSNQVKVTPAGHQFEVDNTPGHERIAETHASGTYRTINADGSRVTVIKGSDYEIIAQGKNVYINGPCNLTISGECRTLIQGNYHLEVNGDFTQNVTGTITTKCKGEIKEVDQNSNNHIGESFKMHSGTSTELTNQQFKNTSASGCDITTAGGNLTMKTTGGSFDITGTSASKITSGGVLTTLTPKAKYTGYIESDNDITCHTKVIADTDVLGGGAAISLVNHVHDGVTAGAATSDKPVS